MRRDRNKRCLTLTKLIRLTTVMTSDNSNKICAFRMDKSPKQAMETVAIPLKTFWNHKKKGGVDHQWKTIQ